MPSILITNDDGIHSEALEMLAERLAPLGEVTIVAPHHESSAIGHALTLARPLRLIQVGARRFMVDGTPTDCVNLAVTKVLPQRPDLVVSGINKGLNVGDDITYSGTVSGALEGALLNIPSLAVSLQRTRQEFDFAQSACVTAALATIALQRGLPARTFLNINVPAVKAHGVRVTVQAKRNHNTIVTERLDPKKRPYFWIEEGQYEWEPHDRSDYQAIRDGWISVTPLQPDLTAHEALEATEALCEEAKGGVE